MTYRTIEIVGSLAPHSVRPGTACRFGAVEVPAEHVVSAPAILAAIDDAEADGARVLLLVVESEGGNAFSGFQVYNRVAAFQRSGGRVVAFVRGRVGSMMPVVAQAADYVVMAGDARFIMHSALGAPEAEVAAVNEACVLALAARTGEPLETLRFLTAEVARPGGDWAIRPDYAIPHGWADRTGTLEDASQLAAELAAGRTPEPTVRSRFLACAPPEPVDLRPLGLAAEIAAHQQQSSESSFIGSPWIRTHEMLAISATAQWSEVSLPVGGHYWTVIWTGRMWIAAGTGNIACSCSDVHAASWQSKALGVAGATWTGLASDGAGRVLAVGATSACSLSTDYGATFAAQTIPIDAKAVCWDRANSVFVAVGTGVCATSATGATGSWTTRSIPNLPAGYNTQYQAVASNGTVLCAVGYTQFSHGICSVSSDGGATWTAHDLYAGASQMLVSVVGYGGFVAVDVMDPGYIWTSDAAGATWTKGAGPSPSSGRPIATDGSVFLLMSNTEYQNVAPALQYPCGWVSRTYGLAWLPRYGPRQTTANRLYTAVASNNIHWVAVAQSADGVTAKVTVSQ